MKRITMSFGRSIEYKPPHPDRTARRAVDWDVEFMEFNSRKVMARTIRMQEKREHNRRDWRAVEPLSDVEGY